MLAQWCGFAFVKRQSDISVGVQVILSLLTMPGCLQNIQNAPTCRTVQLYSFAARPFNPLPSLLCRPPTNLPPEPPLALLNLSPSLLLEPELLFCPVGLLFGEGLVGLKPGQLFMRGVGIGRGGACPACPHRQGSLAKY